MLFVFTVTTAWNTKNDINKKYFLLCFCRVCNTTCTFLFFEVPSHVLPSPLTLSNNASSFRWSLIKTVSEVVSSVWNRLVWMEALHPSASPAASVFWLSALWLFTFGLDTAAQILLLHLAQIPLPETQWRHRLFILQFFLLLLLLTDAIISRLSQWPEPMTHWTVKKLCVRCLNLNLGVNC